MVYYNMKKQITLAIFVLTLLIGSIIVKITLPHKDVHFHAGFQIYINGTLQDFSDAKYMSLVPCTDDLKKKVIIHDKVHLHDEVGDVAHIHQPHVVWNDLLSYLKFRTDGKPFKAYINKSENDNALNTEIHPYDSLVLSIGKDPDLKAHVENSLTKKYIRDVETRNGLCKG
jgi:hypothetical protein